MKAVWLLKTAYSLGLDIFYRLFENLGTPLYIVLAGAYILPVFNAGS